MSPRSEDDLRLTQFLQRHAARVPPAAPDLEDRVMQLVKQNAEAEFFNSVQRRSRLRAWWVLPSAIAVGLVLFTIGQRLLQPPSPVEVAELQTFIETSWQETVTDQPTPEAEDVYLLPDDPSLYQD